MNTDSLDTDSHREISMTTTRRGFMAGTAAGVAGGVAMQLATPGTAGAASYNGNTLVSIFLRGGCDGLSLLPPVGHGAYFDARPTVAVPQQAALPLAGPGAYPGLGWHPGAAKLSALYNAGRVALVPAAGSPDHSRSHFDCQDGIDKGVPENRLSRYDGWLGRFLSGTSAQDHALRAFSAGSGPAPSLRGYPAIAASSIDHLGLVTWGADVDWVTRMLVAGYTPANAGEDLAHWAGVSFEALDGLAPVLAGDNELPKGWPGTSEGRLFFVLARLLEEGMPVQAATMDVGGWDHHDDMGSATDPWARTRLQVAVLDDAIGAFMARMDTAGLGNKVTLVAMTEFGRRVAQNGSGGTDHGFGGPMLVIGAGAVPGVHGGYPGVAPADLVDGDLAVTVDHRTVLAELLARRFGASDLSAVFPGFDASPATFLGAVTA